MKPMTAAALVLSTLLAAGAASAADQPRFTLSLNGVFVPTSIDYSGTRTFQAFAEEGRIDSAYDAGTGPGFEAGLVWNFHKSLGVGVAGGVVSRDTGADYDARVPHPLYLSRDRTAEGNIGGLDFQEQQAHLDLVYTGRSGSLDFTLFAGPTYFNVSSDLLGEPDYSQEYPYDTISVTNVPALSFDDTGFGFNVGAGVAYRFSKSVGFGVQGRFSRASIELVPESGQETVKLDAGGLQVAGGLRIFF